MTSQSGETTLRVHGPDLQINKSIIRVIELEVIILRSILPYCASDVKLISVIAPLIMSAGRSLFSIGYSDWASSLLITAVCGRNNH